MAEIIILDTGPLSNCVVLLSKPGTTLLTPSQQCKKWLNDCEAAGRIVLVPAVAYYEALRELELRAATAQIARLQQFCLNARRFMPLTTAQLESAAKLWAIARKSGQPTASRLSLDADMILSAQALSLGLPQTEYVVATTNTDHIAQFVPCGVWQNISP